MTMRDVKVYSEHERNRLAAAVLDAEIPDTPGAQVQIVWTARERNGGRTILGQEHEHYRLDVWRDKVDGKWQRVARIHGDPLIIGRWS